MNARSSSGETCAELALADEPGALEGERGSLGVAGLATPSVLLDPVASASLASSALTRRAPWTLMWNDDAIQSGLGME